MTDDEDVPMANPPYDDIPPDDQIHPDDAGPPEHEDVVLDGGFPDSGEQDEDDMDVPPGPPDVPFQPPQPSPYANPDETMQQVTVPDANSPDFGDLHVILALEDPYFT